MELKKVELIMTASRRTASAVDRPVSHSLSIGSAVLAAALSIAPAQAQQPPSPPEARIVVGGEGSVSVAPDFAQLRGGVTTRGKTAAEATDSNAKLMAAVIAALRSAGIEQKDIRTSQFSVQPIYALPQSSAEQKVIGFGASNQVTVTVRQIGRVGEMFDRLVAAGATDVGNIAFLHSDPSKVLDQAREAAVADARRKAELYAHAAGLTLGAVAWIAEESGSTAPAGPRMFRAAAALAAPTPIATGEDALRVQITVGFDVAH
jgi:uncharacterized protein YggE